MHKDIQKIIDELIEIDSSFQEKKTELEKLISKIIKSKPDFEINPQFIVELKEELYKQTEFQEKHFFNLKFLQPFGVGVIITLLIVTPLFYKMWGMEQKDQHIQNISYDTTDESMPMLEMDTDDGFGGLARNSMIVPPEDESWETFEVESTQITSENATDLTEKISGSAISSFSPIQYKYLYEGDLDLEETQITVFKKQISDSNIAIEELLQALNLELLDTDFFKNVSVQNLSIKEEREFGYILNFYNENGATYLSLSKNWEKWPNGNENRLKASDLPSNEKLIAIANTFVKQLKIDLTSYGNPVVNTEADIFILEDDENSYIPEIITVTYPILINGEEVVNESGEPTGLKITIDVREEKAAGLTGLTVQKYNSTQAKTVSQTDLEEAIERGSYRSAISYPEDAKIVEVKLGKPEKVLTRISYWDSEKDVSSEILVPALSFPVLEKPADVEFFYTEKIVLPLVADLYENFEEPLLDRKTVESAVVDDEARR